MSQVEKEGSVFVFLDEGDGLVSEKFCDVSSFGVLQSVLIPLSDELFGLRCFRPKGKVEPLVVRSELIKELAAELQKIRPKRNTPRKRAPKKQAAVPQQNKPNVIFVLTDDLGYSDISCYGAKTVKTPHIDRLAEDGIKFTDFHSAASICTGNMPVSSARRAVAEL